MDRSIHFPHYSFDLIKFNFEEALEANIKGILNNDVSHKNYATPGISQT